MDRREALRILATGTALQLAPRKLLLVMREARTLLASEQSNRTLNAHHDATVKAMAEMILPRTDTPGATDVGVSQFVDLMLTEWYDESDRTRFLAGLADVDSYSKNLFGKDFIDCSPAQQSETLMVLGEKMVEDADRHREHPAAEGAPSPESFYSMLRRLTLTAYYTSEAGATQELHFEIIPDHFDGCAPASKEAQQQS